MSAAGALPRKRCGTRAAWKLLGICKKKKCLCYACEQVYLSEVSPSPLCGARVGIPVATSDRLRKQHRNLLAFVASLPISHSPCVTQPQRGDDFNASSEVLRREGLAHRDRAGPDPAGKSSQDQSGLVSLSLAP